ncbi:hypothetical protein L345_05452 [Ophiophagus hannah]|uniref:Uncharacterized protein n=1 Tax=Ophiophagus hannah TaxID=8665 RepID=V8P438_OPHHA|nr:hypothetical protein L345_05452 [Ophiophagus hannah]
MKFKKKGNFHEKSRVCKVALDKSADKKNPFKFSVEFIFSIEKQKISSNMAAGVWQIIKWEEWIVSSSVLPASLCSKLLEAEEDASGFPPKEHRYSLPEVSWVPKPSETVSKCPRPSFTAANFRTVKKIKASNRPMGEGKRWSPTCDPPSSALTVVRHKRKEEFPGANKTTTNI